MGAGGYRNKFDLNRVRLIGFDQRGCGRSVPSASDPDYDLRLNTTSHLIADIEALREHLGVEQWLVNGVSWGSTLALAYARAHPDRVSGLVLMAVTTTSPFEVRWITEAVGAIFPEAWERLVHHAEQAGVGYQRGGGLPLVTAYARLLQHPDAAVRDAASEEWALWEDTHISLGVPAVPRDPRWENQRFRLTFARLVTHYWSNHGFLDPPILAGIGLLRGIPATLIHGRRDISGPASTVWQLHRAWSGSELILVEDEGHGGPKMVAAWRESNTRHIARLLQRS